MDPATLLSVGSTILGGILGKPKNQWVVPDYQKIRDKAEAAGFNPLTALGVAPGSAMQTQSYMGEAIQQSGLMLAENAKKNQELAQLNAFQRENAALQKKVNELTLQAPVPGIYSQPSAMPSLAEAHGVSDGAGYAGSDSLDRGFRVGARASGRAGVTPQGPAQSDYAGLPPGNPIYLGGLPLRPSAQTSDAQTVADRYGEDFMSPSWFSGWGAFIGDVALAARDAGAAYARGQHPITVPAFADRMMFSRSPRPVFNPPSMGRTVSPGYPLGF